MFIPFFMAYVIIFCPVIGIVGGIYAAYKICTLKSDIVWLFHIPFSGRHESIFYLMVMTMVSYLSFVAQILSLFKK